MTEVPAPRIHDRSPVATQRGAAPSGTPFSVQLVRPTRTATVVEVTGDLGPATVQHFLDVVEPRLASVVRTLVVDLSAVTFLDAAGLQALRRCLQRAAATGQGFVLITGSTRACRALEIGEFAACLARTAESVA